MRLIYVKYLDVFGYMESPKDLEFAEEVGHYEIQNGGENREDFFKRVGYTPKPHEYGFDERLDARVVSNFWGDRAECAKQGYGLFQLINDPDFRVRLEVAKHGYALDVFAEDESDEVRAEVARQGYRLYLLADDKSPYVRKVVINTGKYLDEIAKIKNEPSVVKALIRKMEELDECYWIDEESVLQLSEDYIHDYLRLIDKTKEFKTSIDKTTFEAFAKSLIEKFGTDSEFYDLLIKICNENDIKI